jgi:hypothetical protein
VCGGGSSTLGNLAGALGALQSDLPWGLGEVRGLSNWGGGAGLDSKVGRFAGREREVRGCGGRRKGAVRDSRKKKSAPAAY